MILFKKKVDLIKWLHEHLHTRVILGFVPTMGALHAGHLSLIQSAKKEAEAVLCSIFVNPTQFNDPGDFAKYPVSLEDDILLLEQTGCDILYLPSVNEIYPEGFKDQFLYNLGRLEKILEGKYRPGHFQGVCAVVERLLKIVQPGALYLGQKDYQQCMVISKLVELIGMKEKIQIHVCPTLREPDGLAMSSRNRRLNAGQRKTAPAIYNCLKYLQENIRPGHTEPIITEATGRLVNMGFKPDYLEVADAQTLEPVFNWDGRQKIVALAAVFLGETRLIDNLVLN